MRVSFKRYKKAVLFFLVFALTFSLAVVHTSQTTQAASIPNTNERYMEFREKYDIKLELIGSLGFEDLERYYEMACNVLDRQLSIMPEAFVQEIISRINKLHGQMTIRVYLSISGTPDGFTTGYYNRGTIDIYAIGDEQTLLHEFGHGVHEILNNAYGAGKLKTEYTSYNNGAAYTSNMSDYDNKVFAGGYASISYAEDFAETFTFLRASKDFIEETYSKYAPVNENGVVNKAYYIEKVIKEVFPSLSNEEFFADHSLTSPSDWYVADIERAAELGLIPAELKGNNSDSEKGYYADPITRGELSDLISNLIIKKMGQEEVNRLLKENGATYKMGVTTIAVLPGQFTELAAQSPFQDTYSNTYQNMYYLGINGGKEFGEYRPKFKPNDYVTRQEAASFLVNTAKLLGVPLETKELICDDAGKISDWARSNVNIAYASGLMGGLWDNKFRPQDRFKIEEAIVAVQRIYVTVSSK